MKDKKGKTIIRRRTLKEWWEDFKDQWRRYCSNHTPFDGLSGMYWP